MPNSNLCVSISPPAVPLLHQQCLYWLGCRQWSINHLSVAGNCSLPGLIIDHIGFTSSWSEMNVTPWIRWRGWSISIERKNCIFAFALSQPLIKCIVNYRVTSNTQQWFGSSINHFKVETIWCNWHGACVSLTHRRLQCVKLTLSTISSVLQFIHDWPPVAWRRLKCISDLQHIKTPFKTSMLPT